MPGIKDSGGLIDPVKVAAHVFLAPGFQLLVQENGALGAALLGIAELQIAFRGGDELLCDGVGLLRGFVTGGRLGLQERSRLQGVSSTKSLQNPRVPLFTAPMCFPGDAAHSFLLAFFLAILYP